MLSVASVIYFHKTSGVHTKKKKNENNIYLFLYFHKTSGVHAQKNKNKKMT